MYCKLEFMNCLLDFLVWEGMGDSRLCPVRILDSWFACFASFHSILNPFDRSTFQRKYDVKKFTHSHPILLSTNKPKRVQTPVSLFLLRLSSTQTQPTPERKHHRQRHDGSQNRVLRLVVSPKYQRYPERTRQTQVVRFLKDRKCAQRGGQTTRMRHFLVLVEGVLIHRATRLQIAVLARNSRHVLLEHFSTTTHC